MIYRFSGFELDTERRELRKAGEVVAIPPKPFSVLQYLVERKDRMVPKSELLDRFWTAEVSEAALQTTIRVMRKALGRDNGAAAIRTYHGRGIRFVAPVETVSAVAGAPPDTPDPIALREQRLVTVLYVQIRGSEANEDAVEDVLSLARARIDADHGRLMHMMIDGFTAVFGLGAESEDSARRAVACAWDLMASAAVAALGGAVVCGIDTGPVAVTGGAAAGDWTQPGAIERRAAGLAQGAEPGTILLGDATRGQLGDEVALRDTGRGSVLLSGPAGRAGIPARSVRRSAGFVGRDAELAFLNTCLENALAGRGQAVLLSGPAGIGKSRLVREFLAARDAWGPITIAAQCLPRLADTPLAPIREICRAVAGKPADGVVRDAVDRALLARLRDKAAPPAAVLEGLSEQVIRQRSRALFARLIAARCADGPIVLTVEDAHWIDPVSRAHLTTLIGKADELPLLVIVSTRPTDGSPLAEAVLHLSPLGRGDCLRLLDGFPDLVPMGETVTQTLLERAAGNPFFLEELALAAHAGGDPAHDLPNTVQAVIETRIAGLEPDRRALLYAIAIIGPPAPTALIVALLGRATGAVEAELDHLARTGFLSEGGEGVMFRHMLMHDTAYAMISAPDRERLHGEVARFLERADGLVLPETLAWHWQEAGETERAIGYWTKASHAALSRSAGKAAITFAESGLALLDPSCTDSAQQEEGLQLSLAPALMARLGYGAAEVGRAYGRAHELSARTGSVKARVRALLGLWVHTWVAGRLPEALSHGRALLDLAEQLDDPALRLQGYGSIGAVLMHTAALDDARHHLDAGMRLIGADAPDTITLQNAAVTCAAYAAWVAALQGRNAAVHSYVAHCETLSQHVDNSFSEAICLAPCANVWMAAGDVDACATFAERAVTVSRAHRYPFWLGTGLVLQGWAAGQRGHPTQALEVIVEGIAVFDATGAGVQRANWLGIKAETLLAADRLTEGMKMVQLALENARISGDSWFVPRIHAVAAEIQNRCGASDGAKAHATEAARLVKEFGMVEAFARVPRR